MSNQFQFEILNIPISYKNIKGKTSLTLREFQTFGYTPESFRENLWLQIKQSRETLRKTREYKLLISLAMNYEQIALLIKEEDQRPYAEVIVRAVSFLHRIESLAPLGCIESDDKMEPETFYELLKQLGFNLKLVKP